MANGGYYWVSGKLVYQRDDTAEGIINTIQITDGVTLTDAQKFYVRYIVTNLIRVGIWTKIKAFYGFVGGTSATHRWNWKDMRDLDEAYRILWSGGITHNNLGVKGDGITGYGNTFISANMFTITTGISLGIYINNQTTLRQSAEIGSNGMAANPDFNSIQLRVGFNTSTIQFISFGNYNGVTPSTNIPKGMYVANKEGGLNVKSVYVNNDRVLNSTSSADVNISNTNAILVLARTESSGLPGFFSDKGISCIFIADGLTSSQSVFASQIITFAQGILGRQ